MIHPTDTDDVRRAQDAARIPAIDNTKPAAALAAGTPPKENGMRNRIITAVIALAALACLPSIASAHTGSVRCDASGVVFAYNANFSHDTTVTETVTDAATGVSIVREFHVPARVAGEDTIKAPSANVTASASWRDGSLAGSIGPVLLVCPFTPPAPPPVVVTLPPPVVAPPVAAPPVVAPPAPPVALPPPAKCPKGYRLHVTHGTRLCLRTITKRPPAPRCEVGHRVKVGHGWVLCIVRVPAPPHKPSTPGVAG